MNMNTFKKTIWDYYQNNKRIFAWRDVENPYYVLVSEIMLQQTQTYRVEPKFDQFITMFPTIKDLAQAPLRAVLFAWQGLGYNRRAIALKKAAQIILEQHNGMLPSDPDLLQELPGIGPNTAGSLCAFAYNKPVTFIETNIRTVFIHHFFPNQDKVHDRELMPLIQEALDSSDARQWYYALMDYGVMLKKTLPNPSRKSKHHTRQSKFEGSDRQIRGAVLRIITQQGRTSFDELVDLIGKEPQRIAKIVDDLINEGFINEKEGARYSITG